MAAAPPYFVCLRMEANDLDSTLSVFGRWADGDFLREALEALLRQTPPGRRLVVVDVGANVGAAALYFGEILRQHGFGNSRLLALEPEPESAALLRAGVAINNLSGIVEVLEMAASDARAVRPLHKFRTSAGRSSLGVLGGSPRDPREECGLLGSELHMPYATHEVRTARLDEILAGEERVDFLKVDVEGHESAVLEGLGGPLLRSVAVAVVEFRVWALEEEPRGPVGLLLRLAEAGLVPFCVGPCRVELSAVLGPGEQASLLGRALDVRDFEPFVELCRRLKEAGRDFDLLAVAKDIMKPASGDGRS